MTLAQNFVSIINQFDYDENGFLIVPDGFIEAWRDCASVSYPLGTDSFDATEQWSFKDGSTVTVNNPRQRCFSLFVHLE